MQLTIPNRAEFSPVGSDWLDKATKNGRYRIPSAQRKDHVTIPILAAHWSNIYIYIYMGTIQSEVELPYAVGPVSSSSGLGSLPGCIDRQGHDPVTLDSKAHTDRLARCALMLQPVES